MRPYHSSPLHRRKTGWVDAIVRCFRECRWPKADQNLSRSHECGRGSSRDRQEQCAHTHNPPKEKRVRIQAGKASNAVPGSDKTEMRETQFSCSRWLIDALHVR